MPTKEQREKKEAKRLRRMERRAVRDVQDERDRGRQRLRRVGYGLAGLAAVAALAAVIWFVYLQPLPGEGVSTSGAGNHSGAPAGGYSTSPPTSGPHLPQAPSWGEQRELSEALQVHALEHGGVLVQYNCSTPCLELVRNLRSITSERDQGVILAPYSGMNSRIALTSWGRIDLLDEFDEDRVREFVSKNRGHAPEGNQATQ